MTTLPEFKSAVSKLSANELRNFSAWFTEFEAKAWDAQLEKDVAAGHLDSLADEALRDLELGLCKDL